MNTKLIKLLDRVLGQGDAKSKNNVAYHCPFCNHRKKKLEIKLDSNAENFGFWHCWVCGTGGNNLFTLFRKKGVKPELVQILTEIVGHKKAIPRKATNIFEKDEEIIIANFLPKEFKPLYIKTGQPEYKKALHYILNDRKLSARDILRYNIGYCESGRYSGRIIVPSYDAEGNVNFFVARSFIGHERPYDTPPWDRDIVGFELFINWKEPIILTEGVFDAMTIGRNAIPLFGKFLSKRLKRKLFEENVRDVVIALDTDARKEIIQLSEYLMNQGIRVYLLDMKDKDPNVIGKIKMLDLIYNPKTMTRNEILKIKILERI